MLVIHVHWIAPRRLEETGEVLFWAEDSTCSQPAVQHGRLPHKPRPKGHPFQAPIKSLKDLLRRPNAPKESVVLSLPTTRSGPLPSPVFTHNWTLDRETKPFLAPWIITGILFTAQDALQLLLDLLVLAHQNRFVMLGEDARYWRIAATLVIEAFAAQKVMPVIIPVKNGIKARWVPVLDSPRDAQRLSFMEKNMPPVCRAEQVNDKNWQHLAPSTLLRNFFKQLYGLSGA